MEAFFDALKSQLGGTSPQPPRVVQTIKEVPYFAEKRVLITGASSGIGRALASWSNYL